MTENTVKPQRKSNIELLRIVSMLLIIIFHYVYKGGFAFDELTVNKFIVKTCWFFGELGVNLFVLITGYFSCKGKFKARKLILLLLEVLFYHLFSVAVGYFVGIGVKTDPKSLFLTFFPTLLNRQWYITVYVIIYILSPFLNRFINVLTQKEYIRFLLAALTLWSVIPTLFGIFFNTTENLLYYNRLIWLMIIYFVGAYLRLYPVKALGKIKNSLLFSAVVFGFMELSIIIIEMLGGFFAKLGTTEPAYFWPPNSIPMFLLSVGVFSIFLKIDIPYNKFINTLASTTLGIYLLHDGILNQYLWKEVFKNSSHQSSPYLLLHILGTAVIVFAVCAAIDLLRGLIEKHIVIKILDGKTISSFSAKFVLSVEKLSERLQRL